MTGEDNTFSQSSSLYAKAHTAFFGAFSLNKPLVLPVVGKNTIVNKNLAVIIEMVWRPHH